MPVHHPRAVLRAGREVRDLLHDLGGDPSPDGEDGLHRHVLAERDQAHLVVAQAQVPLGGEHLGPHPEPLLAVAARLPVVVAEDEVDPSLADQLPQLLGQGR